MSASKNSTTFPLVGAPDKEDDQSSEDLGYGRETFVAADSQPTVVIGSPAAQVSPGF